MILTCEAPTGELPTPVVCPPTFTPTQPAVPATHTPQPTATATPRSPCIGDCDGDGVVQPAELELCRQGFVGACPACDADGSGSVTADEFAAASQNAANGCPGFPTFTATPTRTATPPGATATATETATALPPTVTPTATGPLCPADCNMNDEVTIDELIRAVNIALGSLSLEKCPAADTSGNSEVTVDEIIRGVNAALNGCPTA